MKGLRIFILFFVLIYLIWTEIQVVAGNSLYLNENWLVGKMTLLFPVEGAYETLVGRANLSNYQLNFDKNFSNHHFISRRTEPIDRFDFRFLLEEKAYLDVLYAKTNSERLGIRLSAHPTSKGLQYRVLKSGEFTASHERNEFNLVPGWHSCSIKLKENSALLHCDKEEGPEMQIPSVGSLSSDFSFRSGNFRVTLAHVTTFFQDQMVWSDHFMQGRLRSKLLQTNGVIFLALLTMFLLYYFQIDKNKELFTQRSVHIAKHIFILCLLWLSFDFLYYSKIPVRFKGDNNQAVQPTISYLNFENMRFRFFSDILRWQWERTLPRKKEILNLGYPTGLTEITICEDKTCHQAPRLSLPSPKAPWETRMVMLGGSLFNGSGASSITNTIFAQLHHQILQQLKTKVTSINGSLSLTTINEQVDHFFSSYEKAQPDFLILAFQTPRNEEEFLALERLFEYIKKNNLPTLVLKKPYNWDRLIHNNLKDARYEDLLYKYHNLISVLDLCKLSYNPEFAKKNFMWWDEYHMTDYAAGLTAKYIHHFMAKRSRLFQSL